MDGFDPYAQWLDVPVDRRPPDYYELLGLTPGESDAARIHAASVERTARVRRYCLGLHSADATRLLGELGAAFACLSDPERKAAYDRQLEGAAGDVSADVFPPPVQRHVETSDEDAPPQRFPINEAKTPALGHSASWSRRRREVLTSGPARFTLAAAFFLAATCGAVWFVRRPPAEAELVGTYVPEGPQPRVPVATSAEEKPPAGEQKKPARSKSPMAAEEPSPSKVPPADITVAPLERDPSPADDNRTAAVLPKSDVRPKSDVPRDRPTVEFDEKFDTVPGGSSYRRSGSMQSTRGFSPAPGNKADDGENPFLTGPRSFGTPRKPLPSRAKPADPSVPASDALPAFSVAQVVGDPDVFLGQPDEGKAWRSEQRMAEEVLELTFAPSVQQPQYIQIFQPQSAPLKVKEVVLYSDDGRRTPISPVVQDPEPGCWVWSLGNYEGGAKRVDITFRRTRTGYVEVDAVAVIDRSGDAFFPVEARATSSAARHDPNVVRTEEPLPTTPREDSSDEARSAAVSNATRGSGEDDGQVDDGRDSVNAIEECARQVLVDIRDPRNKEHPRASSYEAILGDHVYVKTEAAINAVSDLEGIINDPPNAHEAGLARGILKRLERTQKNTPVGREASRVLRSTDYKSREKK